MNTTEERSDLRMPLLIQHETLASINQAAKNAGSNECMGLLASPRASAAITDMCLLPAEASATHAEASPLALRAHVEQLLAKGLIPRGIWHSHGRLPVFHSGTDHGTMERLLPAMAPWNFERPAHNVPCPAVTSPDTAVLPLKDGRLMTFTIIGQALPGGYGHELAKWGTISTKFTGELCPEPMAGFDGTTLCLEAKGVRIELTTPEGATVQSCVEDRAPYRASTLFSLVVNVKRERFAESLEVMDVGGDCRMRVTPCEVLPIGNGEDKGEEMQLPLFLRALAGR